MGGFQGLWPVGWALAGQAEHPRCSQPPGSWRALLHSVWARSRRGFYKEAYLGQLMSKHTAQQGPVQSQELHHAHWGYWGRTVAEVVLERPCHALDAPSAQTSTHR